MMTHKAFEEHLKRVLIQVDVLRGQKKNSKALEVLDVAREEIYRHKRKSVLFPPELVKLECDVYRAALDMVWAGVQ